MSAELDRLLDKLKAYENNKEINKIPKALGFIKNISSFIKIIEKINKLIGMKRIKRQIASRIGSFIVNYHRYGKPTNGEKLHTLLYGASGCGKSMIGGLLAELWACSGCLPSNSVSPFSSEIEGPPPSLKLREAGLRHILEKRERDLELVSSTNNLINRVRRSTKPKTEGGEKVLNSLFSSIKKNLRNLSGETAILPVGIPRFGALIEKEEIITASKFTIITKGDLQGKYQGHTIDQVRKLLTKYIGGVVMIDEAYSLLTSNGDDYGKELLTEIISFMTSHADKIIFIFAGYKEEMKNLLSLQKGLSRRFNWVFEIEEYTSDELSEIFLSQIEKEGFKIKEHEKNNLKNLFRREKDFFPHFGGDTENLCVALKEVYCDRLWERILDSSETSEFPETKMEEEIFIELEDIERALKIYKENRSEKDNYNYPVNYFS